MHLAVEQHRCIAAGQCVLNAPAVFDQADEDGLVVLLDEQPPPAEHDAARLAARLCPASAITVHDE